jgi:hypothetical protein
MPGKISSRRSIIEGDARAIESAESEHVRAAPQASAIHDRRLFETASERSSIG